MPVHCHTRSACRRSWAFALARLVCALCTLPTLVPCQATRPSDHGDLRSRVLANYAAIADAVYADALAGARALESAIARFLDAPSERSLEAAREAWKAARIPYLQSEAFRFCG